LRGMREVTKSIVVGGASRGGPIKNSSGVWGGEKTNVEKTLIRCGKKHCLGVRIMKAGR